MHGNWNHLQAPLIAAACSLEAPSPELGWQSWVDGLTKDDGLKLRGFLLQRFGRPVLGGVHHDSKASAQAHLAKLEDEFSNWLRRPREVIDYVLASRHAGLFITQECWHWLPAHQDLWRFRGRQADSEPQGIRLIPFAESNLERVVSRRLGASLASFFRSLAIRPDEVEEWIVYVEDGCDHLCNSVPNLLGDSISAFYELQKPGRGKDKSPSAACCRSALKDLEHLKAHLPDTLYGLYKDKLQELQQALENYRSPAPRPRDPAPKSRSYKSARYSHISDEYSHFLNNWD